MPQDAQQQISEFRDHTLNEVRLLVSEFTTLGGQIANMKDDQDLSLWHHAKRLHEWITSGQEMTPFEKAVTTSLDVEVGYDIMQQLGAVTERLSSPVTSTPSSPAPATPASSPPVELPDVSVLYLDAEHEELWRTTLKQKEEEKELVEQVSLLIDDVRAFSTQLFHINAVLGLGIVQPKLYLPDEVRELASKQDINSLRLVRTMSESMHDTKLRIAMEPYCTVLIKAQFDAKDEEYDWYEFFLILLSVFVLYERFEYHGIEMQVFLLTYTSYRALLFGVPLRTKLIDALAPTSSIEIYLGLLGFYTDAMLDNRETVPTQDGQQKKSVGDVAQAFRLFAKDQKPGSLEIQKWIATQVPNDKDSRLIRSMLEHYLMLMQEMFDGTIVEHHAWEELSEKEKDVNEMIQLVSWLGVGDAGIPSLITYFSQEEPPVPLNLFIERIKTIIDLEDDQLIDNLVGFDHALHEKKLLAEDQHLLLFDEAQASFMWGI